MRTWAVRAAVTGALALASMLVACSAGGDAGSVPVAEDARLFVDGEPGADVEALREALEFTLVLPSDLPEGWVLADASALGPQSRAPAGVSLWVLVAGRRRRLRPRGVGRPA